jgi:hypothetical protein
MKGLVAYPRSLCFKVLAAAFLLAILWGLLRTPQWPWASMLLAFLGATLAALIANFEYLETFKASSSGIEAKTREVVRQAENALKELHELAAMTGALLVELIVGGGRWGGSGTVAQDAQKVRVLETLRAVGLNAQKVAEIARADRQWVIIDYFLGIIRGPEKQMLHKTENERAKWDAFVQQTRGDFERPGPDETRAGLEQLGLLGDWERAD